jgi:hypothetical protein
MAAACGSDKGVVESGKPTLTRDQAGQTRPFFARTYQTKKKTQTRTPSSCLREWSKSLFY